MSKDWKHKRPMIFQKGASFVSSALEKARFKAYVAWLFVIKTVECCGVLLLENIKKAMAPHRVVPLRRRYFFTKSNSIRMRYAVMAAVCVCAGLISAMMFVGHAAMDPDADPTVVQKIEVASLIDSDHVTVDLDVLDDVAETRSIAKALYYGIGSVASIMKAPDMPKVLKPKEKSIKMKSGDTLAEILSEAGLNNQESFKVAKAMQAHYDPRDMKAGQVINLRFDPDGDDYTFSQLSMKLSPIKAVMVERSDDGFKGVLDEKAVERRVVAKTTNIQTSLYGSALQAGIPTPVVADMIRAYSWNVDFQRDIRSGDAVEVMYEVFETEEGDVARYGKILFANLGVGGNDKPIYRFKMNDGIEDFFEPSGISIRKTLMRTPVDGARLSSGYGMRKHPILGYNKMHKGVDFAAPIGTPIYAAGDGVIEKQGRNGGYGNYVRIRHNSSLKTAYAHLHKYKRGLGVGSHVKQGQVIGYIGTTGRSTGPHLHYEVIVNGVQKNPRSIDLPTGEQLKGAQLEKFKAHMNGLKGQYVSLTDGIKYAQNTAGGQAIR